MREAVGKFLAVMLWTVLIGLVGYLGYQYYFNAPCKNPIEYKIGTVDPRFGVSVAQFTKDIDQAGSIWSDAEGKKLFEYSPNGRLTINLVYDDRQKITQQEQSITSNINSTTAVADSVKQEYTTLKDSYQTQNAAYSAQLAQFNQAQNDYNTQVQYWNDKGGAPPTEYAALKAKKSSLDTQRAQLVQMQSQLNQQADQVNALIDKYNLLVNHINENVDAFNNDGLAGTQFEEGVYISDVSGTRINIYQFNSQTYFIRVLAHELGHSLGLGHNDGTSSIMNPVNDSKNLTLSSDDLADLTAQCQRGLVMPVFVKNLQALYQK